MLFFIKYMARNLGFIVGGLALATTVAFGEMGGSKVISTNNAPSVVEVKVPVINSFNIISSNNVPPYIELKGKLNIKNLNGYNIQSTTNLSSNIWQNMCSLESCADSKKVSFSFLEPCNSYGKYYRLNYTK